MPELPEVETIVRELKNNIINRRIDDVWTDVEKLIIKKPTDFHVFRKELKGRVIKGVRRRAKNILIDLSGKKTLLIHQKMTGHLLIGKWKKVKGDWISKLPGPLEDDARNRFLHLIFFLSDGFQLALSDQRKFAKAEIWDTDKLESEFKNNVGPEPLEKTFTLNKFRESLLKRKKGRIKNVLMDQRIIAGIGNIYADEILWEAKINPLIDINSLDSKHIRKIYSAMKKILKKGIELGGDSFYSYRMIDGTKGDFGNWAKIYARQGEKCRRCKAEIKRKKISSRSAHFCPICQPIKI